MANSQVMGDQMLTEVLLEVIEEMLGLISYAFRAGDEITASHLRQMLAGHGVQTEVNNDGVSWWRS